MKKIALLFGYGYVCKFVSKALKDKGYKVYVTSRQVNLEQSIDDGIEVIHFFNPLMSQLIASADMMLSTVPPTAHQDPVLQVYLDAIIHSQCSWIGYLSSTSVYGDHDGQWVNEQTKCMPTHVVSQSRLMVEQQWLSLHTQHAVAIHIFRLSGIYGPYRNCLEALQQGKDCTIVRHNHYFSRIHVEDICQVILRSIELKTPGEIYNVSDDEPAALSVVEQYAALLLHQKKLQEIALEQAAVSEQMRMFFKDSKKVSNDKVVNTLKIQWLYPNYRVGLQACLPYLKNV